MAQLNMVAALNLALDDALRTDESVVLLGQDIGVDEGVFRVTANLLNRYGDRRVLDTPLAEGAIVGGAIGMALYGLKPVAEMQFSGFAYQGFHQIEQHVSRFRNRTRGRFPLPMVVRMPYGGGIRPGLAVGIDSACRSGGVLRTQGRLPRVSGGSARRTRDHAAGEGSGGS